jgi:hypothetical protein
MTARPIRENHVRTEQKRAGMNDSKSVSYLVPDQMCATCGGSTRKSMHWDCRRDRSGRLLVKGTR